MPTRQGDSLSILTVETDENEWTPSPSLCASLISLSLSFLSLPLSLSGAPTAVSAAKARCHGDEG